MKQFNIECLNVWIKPTYVLIMIRIGCCIVRRFSMESLHPIKRFCIIVCGKCEQADVATVNASEEARK